SAPTPSTEISPLSYTTLFRSVVEQRGRERDLVEPDVGHDPRHLERMVDVALAARADLVAMRFLGRLVGAVDERHRRLRPPLAVRDRKSTRLNSSHVEISYAVF